MKLDDETKRAALVAAAGAVATILATAAVEALKQVAAPLWKEFGPRAKGSR